jgi:hypothetical protein
MMAEVCGAASHRARGETLTSAWPLLLALLLTPAAMLAAPDAPMLMQVRAAYGYDARNERVISGGYSLAGIHYMSADPLRAVPPDKDPDARRLYWSPLHGGSKQLLFREADGWIAGFRVSSAGLIALMTQNWVLRVLDANGRVLRSLEDVIDYQWSPDGTRLAYCTGHHDDPQGDARPIETWMLEFAGGAAWKVFEGGRHAAWARFDGGLYVYDVRRGSTLSGDRVWRYDPRERTLRETLHRGIYFSPSGSFYYMDSPNFGTFDVYEAGTAHSLRESGNVLANLYAEPVAWLEGHDLLVLESAHDIDGQVRRGSYRSLLYDPRADRVTEIGDRALIGFGKSRTLVFVEDGVVRVEGVERWVRTAEGSRVD